MKSYLLTFQVIECEIERSPKNGKEILFSNKCFVVTYENEYGDEAQEVACERTPCSREALNRQECICGGMVFKDGRANSGYELSKHYSDICQAELASSGRPLSLITSLVSLRINS